jgi:hypothetical protein
MPPLRSHSCFGALAFSSTSSSSSSLANVGEHVSRVALAHCRVAGPPRHGLGPWSFPLENKSGNSLFLTILKLSPCDVCKSTHSPHVSIKIAEGPLTFENQLQIGPKPSQHTQKINQNPQKIQKFCKSPRSSARKLSNH